ncbi:MAG: methyltransferase domain-containing protein [Geminicoccaceae bacterium]
MFVAENAWFRDNYVCATCGSIPRERALMLVLEERFPDWRNMQIHESSPGSRGASLRLARECSNYVPSQYFPDVPPGEYRNGIRCENLEAQTFADDSFDLHVTQDVFEHIFDPAAASREIARTLRVGGAHLFTVPLVNKRQPSCRRARRGPDGAVEHLAPPEYHGNPIDASGSLVTIDWGMDIVQHILESSGLITEIVTIDRLDHGIRAEYIEVLVSSKHAPVTI